MRARSLFVLLPLVALAGPASGLVLTPISTNFNNPIGIDHHEPTGTLIVSVNYPGSGGLVNFERILQNGTHAAYTSQSGLTNELKIATARSGFNCFTPGDVFSGNGVDGMILRITSANGGAPVVINPWVDLQPGANTPNGLLRGSLYVDQTGVYGGDLIVVTDIGQVWRVTCGGAATKVAEATGVHLEGLVTVPPDPSQYGGLAGKILAGAEGAHLLYAFDANGATTTYSVGVDIEDIDMIPPNQNFFGVMYRPTPGKIVGAPPSQWAANVGDILLTQELPSGGGSGLFVLTWNFSTGMPEATQLSLSAGSPVPTQWEHVTFSSAGVAPLSPVCSKGNVDHYKCYKALEPARFTAYADLQGPQFGLEAGCKIGGRALEFCVPVCKLVTAIQAPHHQPFALTPFKGEPLAEDQLCYKVTCTSAAPPTVTVVDQFGQRTIQLKQPRKLCTPAAKVLPPPTCGDTAPKCNGTCPPGAKCVAQGHGCTCFLPKCLDGVVDPDEQCDDGNRLDGDGCDTNCTFTTCGNGVVTEGEECDDGNRADGDGCRSNCMLERCGDGIVQPDLHEECDDGNTMNGDGCSSNCLSEFR